MQIYVMTGGIKYIFQGLILGMSSLLTVVQTSEKPAACVYGIYNGFVWCNKSCQGLKIFGYTPAINIPNLSVMY